MTKQELENPQLRKLVKEGKPLNMDNEKAALKLIEQAARDVLAEAPTTAEVR
jgi:hypothetical protein